jgi:hydrogenase maturation protease
MLLDALQSCLLAQQLEQIEFLEDFQLQIEHALDMVGRKRVLFVDASLNGSAPFEVSTLQAVADASLTTHTLSPQALMQVYQNLHGEAPPPCTLLAIRGYSFELGDPLSQAAVAHLDAAKEWAIAALAVEHSQE